MDQLRASANRFAASMKSGKYGSTILEYAVICGLTISREEKPTYLDKVAELAQQGLPEDELRKAISDLVLQMNGITE